MEKKKIGIYIHIPFCAKKCDYCDFISYSNCSNKIEEYVQALKKEINNCTDIYDVNTIYIGGGTPSFIESRYIAEILATIQEKFNVLNNAEITIEINPGTVNKEKIIQYKRAGINRISIGLQSANDDLLKEIGRIHNFEQFVETYNLTRQVGFNNINVDLMLALPNQTEKVLEESVKEVLKLNPEHISIYSLILEEKTKLYNKVQTGKIELPSDDTERKMYWKVKKMLESKGYIHYEISNFAKKGYESKHNMNCWKQEEYIGFGLAAHSYLNKKRYSNIENLEQYINGKNTKIIHEVQNKKDEQNEYMMLGLRKIDGVSISKFKEKFIQNPIYIYRKELNKLVEEQLIQIDMDSIKLTEKGIDFANIVWEEFV